MKAQNKLNFRPLDKNTPPEYNTNMKQNIKKKIVRRLKILEGQVRGLQRMVEEEQYCVDILQQSSAARQAISSIEDLILENHLSTHVIKQIKSNKSSKAINEILSIYQLSKRK